MSCDVPVTPEDAPVWLRPLLRELDNDRQADRMRAMLASRVAQRGGQDQAAVLIVFTGDHHAQSTPENAAVLITHRHPGMRSHSGQMAFPGGRIDPQDAGPVAAALRETTEETGLSPDRVIPLAVLAPITTGGSRRRVRPVLAYVHDPGTVYPASPDETDDVFFVPLSALVNPANRRSLGRAGWTAPAFTVGGYLIWGFTGIVLSVLLDLGGWARPWDRTPGDLDAALEQSCNGERRM